MDAEDLIESVRVRKVLWDKHDKHYHNRHICREKWIEVSKEVDVPVEEAQRKWKNLRDVFRKELKKKPRIRPGGRIVKYKSKWSYFENMLFLKPALDLQNIDEDDGCTRDGITVKPDPLYKAELEEFENSKGEEHFLMKSSTVETRRKKKRKLNEDEEDTLNIPEQYDQKLKIFQENQDTNPNDDYHFLMSFLPSMSKIPNLKKQYFRLKMQELLCNTLSEIEGEVPCGTGYTVSSEFVEVDEELHH